ncbi:MAG: TonB family protein [Pyrinomonadaceae bacterium]
MRNIMQAVFSFLLNGVWQITAIALFAALGNYLLGSATRYRHLLWVAALGLSLLLPLISSAAFQTFETSPAVSVREQSNGPFMIAPTPRLELTPPVAVSVSPGFHVGERLAIFLLTVYLLVVCYRSAKLIKAALKTRAVQLGASELKPEGSLSKIIEQCRREFGVKKVRFLSSPSMPAAATLGIFRSVVILPEELLRAGDDNALAAAIGHELVHIARHDYLLNLIYELIFLPLSFHPATALIKRWITQTRELRCDELVSERLLHPEVYARSLVRLAGLAMPFTRRSQTMIVGIADADILEVRIMTLLRSNKSNFRRSVFGLTLAALLLAVPCVAAAALAVHFNIDSPPAGAAQEPSREVQEKPELEARRERQVRERWEKETAELKQRIATETNPQFKADLEKALEQREREKVTSVYALEGVGYAVSMLRNEEGARQEREREERQKTELARAAKISMDQAIQIATSKTPGKVLECSLVAERWDGQGELAKPGLVLYHVIILSGDESNPITTHVLVNAVDGTIFRAERQERKTEEPTFLRTRRPQPIEGARLNGKAITLPEPVYPEMARAAGAQGDVNVRIIVDENGNVISAEAVSGHPLLRSAAVDAARAAKFAPTRLSGEPVKVSGLLTYNFLVQ